MVFITSIVSSQEWIRLSEAAQHAFPGEVLALGRNYADILLEWSRGIEGGH